MKKCGMQKKLYSLDTSIDVLHLSLRPTNVLRDNNINTLGQLIHLIKTDKKSFLNLKNLGKTSAEEIRNALDNIEIIGLQEDSYTDLIDNYNFSKRAQTVFGNQNIKTISELRKYSFEEIKNWKNVGRQTLDEIIDMLSSLDESKNTDYTKRNSICTFVLNESKISSLRKKTINDYNFSNRTLNALKSKNIETLEDLRKYPIVEIKKWRNVGQKTIDEIIDALSLPIENFSQNRINICLCVSETVFKFYTVPTSVYEKILTENLENIESIEQFLCAGQSFTFSESSVIDVILFHKDFLNSKLFRFCESVSNELNSFVRFQKITVSQTLLSAIKCILLKKIGQKRIYTLDSEFCKILCDDKVYVTTVKSVILDNLKTKTDSVVYADISALFPSIIQNAGIIEVALLELEENKLIRKLRNETFEIIYPSVVDYIKSIKDEKLKDILERKIIKGQTLEEIGQEYNISRERIRQIIFKNFNKRTEELTFAEDKYAFIYQKYKFKREQARLIFGDITSFYFSTVYDSGKTDLEECLDDKSIPQNIRRKIQKEIIYTDYIYVGNQYVKKYRPALYQYYIKRYCTEDTEIDTFVKNYSAFWQKQGLEKEVDEINKRAFQGVLMRSTNVMYKYPRTFRFYDFDQYDFSDLLDSLNLSQYENVMLSTAKFVKEYPKLMKKYDIRDEYELHSLLRTLLENKDKNITFHRMPTIEFGKADVDNQVIELLNENAPISPEKLSILYEEKYGTQAATARGTYFYCISKYLHKGLYQIDLPSLTKDEFDYLKQQLVNDFYTLNEVRQVYAQKFSDLSHINPITLKEIGFIVNDSYIVQGKFESAANYFKFLLLENEKFCYEDISPIIRHNVTFNMVLNNLLDNYDILEYDKKKYINFNRFSAIGITKGYFNDFCKQIYTLDLPEYFSMKQIKGAGFNHKLFELGFDDWFYEKILAQNDNLFSSQQIGGRIILSKGEKNITWASLLEDIIPENGMDIYRLADKLNADFGMKISKDDILTRTTDSDLYYDKIMEKLYRTYDDYFEEI